MENEFKQQIDQLQKEIKLPKNTKITQIGNQTDNGEIMHVPIPIVDTQIPIINDALRESAERETEKQFNSFQCARQ